MIFDAAAYEAGEAAREFALAIASGRLNLVDIDKTSLLWRTEDAGTMVREFGTIAGQR